MEFYSAFSLGAVFMKNMYYVYYVKLTMEISSLGKLGGGVINQHSVSLTTHQHHQQHRWYLAWAILAMLWPYSLLVFPAWNSLLPLSVYLHLHAVCRQMHFV